MFPFRWRHAKYERPLNAALFSLHLFTLTLKPYISPRKVEPGFESLAVFAQSVDQIWTRKGPDMTSS